MQSEAKTDQPPSETLTESTQTPTAQETAESTVPSEQVETNQHEAPEEDEPNEPVEHLEPDGPDQSDEFNLSAEKSSTGLFQPLEPEASEPVEIEEENAEEPQVVTAAN